MNIENKIRANDRSIWVLDQFLWEKRSRNYIDDDGWTHKNPGYEYPVLTGKVLRAETNRGKNKNDGQPELLPSFHSFPSVQACSRRQRCNLYISTSTENRNRFQ